MRTTSKKKGLNRFKSEPNRMRTESWFGLVQETVRSQFSSKGSFSQPVLFPVHKKMLQNRTKPNHGITSAIRVWDLSPWELIKIPAGDWAHLNDQIIMSGKRKQPYDFWDVTSGTPIRFSATCQGFRRSGLYASSLCSQ